MITFILPNIIYLLFPFLVYFLYEIYSNATLDKENEIFFDLAIISSFYLVYKYGNINIYSLFLLNIPLLISIYKKRYFSIIVLLLSLSFVSSNIFNIIVIIFILEYIFIVLTSYFTKRKINNTFFLFYLIFTVINLFISSNINYYFILIMIISYFSFMITIDMCDKLSKVIKVHLSLGEITKEKKLYESLFKITHEIKNPLAVCKGYLDMFDVNNKIKAKKYIGIINQEVDRTLLLLKDFSDFSKLKIEKTPIDINMLVEDVCDEAKLVLKGRIKFEYYVGDEEIFIEGDYNRLKQVLVNVIKNSKESITKNGKISLTTMKNEDNYIIKIKDNGIGMDKETLNKIGTPFFTSKKNGTGLGVCLSKEIIERHDGTIKYTSDKKKGTLVEIFLPYKKSV